MAYSNKWSHRVRMRPHLCIHCNKYSSRPPKWLDILFLMTGTRGDTESGYVSPQMVAEELGMSIQGARYILERMVQRNAVRPDIRTAEKMMYLTAAGEATLQRFRGLRKTGVPPRMRRILQALRNAKTQGRTSATRFGRAYSVSREYGRQVLSGSKRMGLVEVRYRGQRFTATRYGKLIRFWWAHAGYKPVQRCV